MTGLAEWTRKSSPIRCEKWRHHKEVSYTILITLFKTLKQGFESYWHLIFNRADDIGEGSLPLLQLFKKKERETKVKKGSVKVETIKSLSSKSKCYCFSHSRASRIKKFFLSDNYGGRQYFSVFHGPFTLIPISPALLTVAFERLLDYRVFNWDWTPLFERLLDYRVFNWDWTPLCRRGLYRLVPKQTSPVYK